MVRVGTSEGWRLPVVGTIRNGIEEVVVHWRALLRASLAPAMVSGALAASGAWKHDDLMFFAKMAAQLIPESLIAMSCHRIVLLGEQSLPDPLGVYWTSRETRFLLWWALVLHGGSIAVGAIIGLTGGFVVGAGYGMGLRASWVWVLGAVSPILLAAPYVVARLLAEAAE